jgi:predicted transcriptional regulator
MPRAKITAYVTPDIAETLKRVAAIDDRSVSDIVEDAILQKLMAKNQDAEQAAIIASLGQVTRRLTAVERNLETHFELSAQSTRFLFSVAPDIPEPDRASFGARGRDRLNNMLSVVIARLASGRSTLQDAWNLPESDASPPSVKQEAAQ